MLFDVMLDVLWAILSPVPDLIVQSGAPDIIKGIGLAVYAVVVLVIVAELTTFGIRLVGWVAGKLNEATHRS